METIYAVVCETFESYTVEGVFSTPALAEVFMREYKIDNINGCVSVAEWTVDKNVGFKRMPKYNAVISTDSGLLLNEYVASAYLPSSGNLSAITYMSTDGRVSSSESTISAEHALQIAQEERLRYLKEGPNATFFD
jgi:hypothetical protein